METSITNYAQQVDEILNSLDVSDVTLKSYQHGAVLFLRFLQNNPFNFNTFLEYKKALALRADLAIATKNKYLASARVLLKEFNRRGVLKSDITQNIKGFQQSRKHKKPGLTDQEAQAFLDLLKGLKPTKQNLRLKAFFCLLAFQGLRQIEIVRLDVEDIDLINGKAFIQSKGEDDKEQIHLHPETVISLQQYLKSVHTSSGAVFKSHSNHASDRLSTHTIKVEITRVLRTINSDKTTHGFRHFYITSLLKELDVRTVRKFSRHKNLEMLVVYDDELDISNKSKDVFKIFDKLK